MEQGSAWENASAKRAIRFCFRILFIALTAAALASPAVYAETQASAANMSGRIADEQGAVIEGATVTIISEVKNIQRTTQTLGDGSYRILAVPPGDYQVSIEAPGFAKAVYQNIILNLGQEAVLNAALRVTAIGEEVIVTGDVEMTDRSKTSESFNIDQRRIDNLPIDGRNFLNFALTSSQVSRDSSAPIGPAPTTGLVFGGQRPRSNLIQIDGADNIDNSVNASRSTISQEAVQEFQVLVNGFAPEFGRTLGGVVNIVTRSGSDEFHGSVFGFLRQRDVQARNALAFTPDGSKPAFTRGQYGFTFSGPVVRNRTFFFAAVEQNRRQESGFNIVGIDKSIFDLTPAQKAYVAANPGALGSLYQQIATSGASVAKTGVDVNTGLPFFFPAFLLTGGQFGRVPSSYRTFDSIENVYPITNKFSFYSIKLDQVVNDKNRLSIRYNFTPSTTTGLTEGTIPNDRTRTAIVELRDTALVIQDTQIFSSNKVNELLFQFARRGASFISSDFPSFNVGSVITFGRSALSPIDRIERRYELKDNFSYSTGNHNTKFGFDINYISGHGRFDLAFAGLYQFGDISATAFSAGFAGAPSFNAIQSYGLGIPQNYVQGFGDSRNNLLNRTFGFYGQDSWRIRPNLTFNYGARYDIELTQLDPPLGISSPNLTVTAEQITAAQVKLGIVKGLPRDRNNVAPRAGISWDIFGDGDTLVRAAYGTFFDHPPLFVGFNSTIIDGVKVPQFVALGGSPSPTAPLNGTQIFSGSVVPGTTPGVPANLIYLPDLVRFDTGSFPGYGTILPSLISIARNFTFSYSHQVNLGIEQRLTSDMSFLANYTFTGGRSLPRPRNINAPNAKLILQVSPQGNFTDPILIANNFFRPSGPSPVFIKTDMPIPFGAVNMTESAGSSVYHAFTAELRKRFSRNYQLFASYTFSKVIDDSIDITNLQTAQDNNNPGLERSASVLDQRHRFVLSGIFTSPFSQSDPSFARRVLSNFTLSSILELSAGRPFVITTGTDTNLDQQAATDRPNVDEQGNLTLPQLGQIGNLGRNPGVSPGFASVNLRIARQIPFGERLRLELIAEAFNLFNRVNIDKVSTDFRNVTFRDGRFRSTALTAFDPRQFQFAMRLSF